MNSVSAHLNSLNSSLIGGTSNRNYMMDFVVPQPQDPPFVTPATYCWRSKNMMMNMGRCNCHNHQQNFIHQMQDHHNGAGFALF